MYLIPNFTDTQEVGGKVRTQTKGLMLLNHTVYIKPVALKFNLEVQDGSAFCYSVRHSILITLHKSEFKSIIKHL